MCIQHMKAGDCECCGSYFGESEAVFVDGVLVWENSTDGHLGAFITEMSLKEAMLTTVDKILLENLHANHYEWVRNHKTMAGENHLLKQSEQYYDSCLFSEINYYNFNKQLLHSMTVNLPSHPVNTLYVLIGWIQEYFATDIKLIVEM